MPQTEELQKVTVKVPVMLLKDAQAFTGAGPTQTITAGLEKLAASKAYMKMRDLHGSCSDLDIDVPASRADRSFE